MISGTYLGSPQRPDINLGQGIFVLGLAEGFEPTIQGLAVSFVDPGATGRLFTLIAAIDQVATLISGPIMGQIFAASQQQGLIYVVASVS